MNAEQLKNSILQRAIEGKLVEQREEEGTAAELLREIKAEKARLVKEGKLKKEKPLPEIKAEEIPFEIPESWEWVRHNELFMISGGSQPPKSFFSDICKPGYVRLYQIRDYGSNPIPIYVPSEKVSKFTESGDILLARYGASLGKVFHAQEGAYNVAMAKVILQFDKHAINMDYLFMFYQSSLYQNVIHGHSRSAQAGFNKDDLKTLLFPLPPLAEQKRIVAKIEELLPHVEQYGKSHDELTALNEKFPDAMKKSVLQYAMEGKLVEQREEEGTAAELLREIKAEKTRLVKEGKLKKEKPLPEIKAEEIPFEIPESWKWVRLGEISTYGSNKLKISPRDITPEMWTLDMEDIEKESGRIIRREYAKNRTIAGDKIIFRKGEILYSKLRPYLKKVLVAPADGICTSELVPFQCYADINAEYVTYYLRSPYVTKIVNAASYGVKMPRVNKETMIELPVPLPPLAEQKRIVAKIEELLVCCGALENETTP